MSSKEIVFDTSLFIPDRYFSQKSTFLYDKDIYKDGGRILPIIPPVRHHLDMSTRSNSTNMNRRSSMPASQKKQPVRTTNSPFVSPLKKRVEKLQPINRPQILKDGAPMLVVHNATPSANDAELRATGSRNTLRRDTSEDDMLGLSSRQVLEKSKEIIKGLEPPVEIYRRLVQSRKENSTGELTPNKTGVKQLQTIVKKLDLTMEVSTSGRNSFLDEMKKVPVEYYQKARVSRRREKSSDNSDEKSRSRSRSRQEVKEERDDSRNNVQRNFLKIASFDEEEEFTPRNSGARSVNNLSNKDASMIEAEKEEKRWYLCPIGPSLYNRESNPGSRTNLSMRSILPDLNEKVVEKLTSRPSGEAKSFEEEGRITRDLKETDKKKWLARRVSNLGQEIMTLKNETNNDLGVLKNYQKKYMQDIEKLKAGNSGISEDQLNIDKEHFEDLMNERKKTMAKANNALIKNYAKEGMHLKNKQERMVDNIRFERHMAKIDKKIEEKFRSKVSSVNLRKRRFVSESSSKDL